MGEDRPINSVFMLGLIAIPIVFVWFLFLPRYARSTRKAALTYTFAPSILAMLHAVTMITAKAVVSR